MNPKKLIIKARISILSKDLNSAKQPYFCASSLWANSCSRNPNPTVNADIRMPIRKFIVKENPVNTIAKATEMIDQAFAKSVISFLEVFRKLIWLIFLRPVLAAQL